MESLNRQLKIIREKFPKQEGRIEELYSIDEDFRTLCADYFFCVQYLENLQKNKSQKRNSATEYEELRKELEKELSRFIHDT